MARLSVYQRGYKTMLEAVHRKKWLSKSLIVAVVIGIFLALGFIPIASFSFGPGDAIPVNTQIHFSGEHSMSGEGKVLMADVLLTQLSPITWLLDHLNPEITIYPAYEVFGNSIPSNVPASQIGEMLDAKTQAVLAALNYSHTPYKSISGALVQSVESQTSSKIHPGDIIFSVDGLRTSTLQGAVDAITKGSSKIRLVLLRQAGEVGAYLKVSVVATKFHSGGREILGVGLSSGSIVQLGTPIMISTGQIGGPSAGLAFTLGILQARGLLHLYRSSVIAATGTIDATGNVGDVGGVRQKAFAVARQDAHYFLVPPQEYQAALSAGIKNLHIVSISSLRQALGFIVGHKLGYLTR